MRFTRTIVVGLVALAITLTTTHSSVAAEGSPFRNGKAKAVATVFGFAPGVGNLSLGITSGTAVAEVTNKLAQAQSKVLDLGLIGTSLTAQQCDGSPGPVRQDQLPVPVSADNRTGGASASQDSIPLAGSALGGGRQEASATTDPASHASVTGVASSLGPLVSIGGGSATASTRVVDGVAREAEAVASMDIDIAGVVQLGGLHWRAFHRTGDGPAVDGTFEIASGTAGGVPFPTDQLAPAQEAINAALAPSGVTVELPHVEHLTSPNELLRVSPLVITLRDSPLGKTAVGPVLGLTRAQREQLFDSITAIYCQSASLLLVGDVTLDVVSGTGFMTVSLGGVEATSGDTIDGNPFGDVPPLALPAPPNGAPAPASPASGTNPAGVAAPAPATAVASPAPALGPIDHVCVTLHVSARPGCSRGMGWPVGIAGVALTAGMGYLDWRRQRGVALAEATTS